MSERRRTPRSRSRGSRGAAGQGSRYGAAEAGPQTKGARDGAEATAKANVTDPESRIMKTQKGYVQGSDAQAVVTAEPIIVAAAVTQEADDGKPFHPMLERAQANLEAGGHPEAVSTVLADAGYWIEANVTNAEPAGPELLRATNKDWKQRKALREPPPPRGRYPKGLTARDRMERTLLTKRGRRLDKKRARPWSRCSARSRVPGAVPVSATRAGCL